MIELSFGWPPKELSPNSRCHWSTKAKAAKKYKEDCLWICKARDREQGRWPFLTHITVSFHPPSKRRADVDNMVASSKQLFDAVSEWLGIDDSNFKIIPIKADPVKNGAVKVCIR